MRVTQLDAAAARKGPRRPRPLTSEAREGPAMAPQRAGTGPPSPAPSRGSSSANGRPRSRRKGGAAPESTSPDLGAYGGERVATHAGPAPGGTRTWAIAAPTAHPRPSPVTGHVAGPMRIRIKALDGA